MNRVMMLPIVTTIFATAFAASLVLDSPETSRVITFYDVPLVCDAAPHIGCGSRAKPLFLDMEGHDMILESWLNRPGTQIAVVWDQSMTSNDVRNRVIAPLLQKHKVNATEVVDLGRYQQISHSLETEQWYRGTEVDRLSQEEAGVIAEDIVQCAVKEGLITDKEARSLKAEFTAYFQVELTKTRTYEELASSETQNGWVDGAHRIASQHIGKERADKLVSLYEHHQECEGKDHESCGDEKTSAGCCSKEKKGSK